MVLTLRDSSMNGEQYRVLRRYSLLADSLQPHYSDVPGKQEGEEGLRRQFFFFLPHSLFYGGDAVPEDAPATSVAPRTAGLSGLPF